MTETSLLNSHSVDTYTSRQVDTILRSARKDYALLVSTLIAIQFSSLKAETAARICVSISIMPTCM